MTALSNVDEVFNCQYAGTTDGTYKTLTSNVVGNIVKLADDRKSEGADSYVEIGFNGGTLDAGQSMTIQAVVNKSNWTLYDRSNDLSYGDSGNIDVVINN